MMVEHPAPPQLELLACCLWLGFPFAPVGIINPLHSDGIWLQECLTLICLAMVKKACSTLFALFAEVSRNGIPKLSANSLIQSISISQIRKDDSWGYMIPLPQCTPQLSYQIYHSYFQQGAYLHPRWRNGQSPVAIVSHCWRSLIGKYQHRNY